MQLNIGTIQNAKSKISIYPHAWVDAPSGVLDENKKWTNPRSSRYTFVFLMTSIGILLFLSVIGAAAFNIRRTLSGRLRPPK